MTESQLNTEEFDDFDETGIPFWAAKTSDKPGAAVFYNPRMSIGRDLVLAAAFALVNTTSKTDPIRVCDSFCASGIVGLRLVKAFGDRVKVVSNDFSAAVAAIAQKNIDRNSMNAWIETSVRSAEGILSERAFDFVTLDPYGSPASFLDATFNNTPKNGVVCITCTDVATIYGAAPQSARRHYGSSSFRGVIYHRELGARIVLACIAGSAARHGKGIEVLYTVSTDHFLQIGVRVTRGAQVGDRCMEQIMPLLHCVACDCRAFGKTPECGHMPANPYANYTSTQKLSEAPTTSEGSGDTETAHPRSKRVKVTTDTDVLVLGPCWSGPLYDLEFVQKMKDSLAVLPFAQPLRISQLLETILAEARADAPLFYVLNSHSPNPEVPAMKYTIQVLTERGFSAARPHFNPTCLRTNASAAQLRECLGEASKRAAAHQLEKQEMQSRKREEEEKEKELTDTIISK